MIMQYVSTRGGAAPQTFRDVVLAGMASDGGLFLPDALPDFSGRLGAWRAGSYTELCAEIMTPFVGDDPDAATLAALIERAYATFDTPAVAPVVMLGPLHVVELFHGPTLAFKDVALQFLGQLFEHYLSSDGRRMTVVGATSGDTGSAAIHALKGKANVEVFILYPEGRVSPMQERQMTTVAESNIHAVAVEGSFDDAQAIVKGLFADRAFNERYGLGAINSINWARVLAQTVYFFSSYLHLVRSGVVGLGEPVRCTVPTGNFGHIFAGHLARRMGLPIEHLVLATNANDILYRFIQSGTYSLGEVAQTLSPSMDIQVASNFERYLYELAGNDSALLGQWLETFAQSGELTLAPAQQEAVEAEFLSMAVDDQQTLEVITRMYREHGYLLDPHSAIAIQAGLAHAVPEMPMLAMATAHPAKFASAIEQAIKQPPPLPEQLSGLAALPQRKIRLPATQAAVRQFIQDTLPA
jgi:threonine synthase